MGKNNELSTRVGIFYHMELVPQALPALESVVNTVLQANQLIMQNIVDADQRRVTSLFPVEDLRRALRIGEEEHQPTPFFDMQAIHHYHP